MARRPAWTRISKKDLEKARKNTALVPCAFCKGTGKDPYGLSHLSNCVACGGTGNQLAAEPYETCPACEGTGLYLRSHLYCWTCRGKGVIHVPDKGVN